MTFVPARAGLYQSTVVDNVRLSERYFLLRLSRPAEMRQPSPGQFMQVAVPETGRFFLRRPFSVFECNDQVIEFLILERGAGTRAIRKLQKGARVDYYGPLGNEFPPQPGKKILAVAGGVGLAPLYFYGFGVMRTSGRDYRLLYGGRTSEDMFLDVFDWEGKGVLLSTDDGSCGFAGDVVGLARQEIARARPDVIFSCGPTAMLEALDRLAVGTGTRHLVSLENRMGCGLGACRACVVPTSLENGGSNRTVCHDGPVFDASDLVWEELPEP